MVLHRGDDRVDSPTSDFGARPAAYARQTQRDQVGSYYAVITSNLNIFEVLGMCPGVEFGGPPVINLNEILPGKCVVCFSRGRLQRYAGHFKWLKGSICSRCKSQRAEPLGAVLLWISVNGGPDACADVAGGWVIYCPPNYVGWEAIRQLYTQEIDGMLSFIESELGQEYAQALRTGRPNRLN